MDIYLILTGVIDGGTMSMQGWVAHAGHVQEGASGLRVGAELHLPP